MFIVSKIFIWQSDKKIAISKFNASFIWRWPNTSLEVSPWCLKKLSRTHKIHLFNWIKTHTIRQRECREPQGVVRPKFEVDVDCSTCGYRLSVEASSVGVFIGSPTRGGIHNIAGVSSHQHGRHTSTVLARFYWTPKVVFRSNRNTSRLYTINNYR